MTMPIILLIDDDPAVLRSMAALLATAGYQVITTSNLQEAVEAARANDPDLAMIDYSVCTGAGMCTAHELRTVRPEIRLLLHTGNPDVHSSACLVDLPVLVKPVAPDELLAHVKEILATDGRGKQ